jgi:hypothetical protein
MDDKQTSIRKSYQTVAWGILAILWGITILFDFIPFGAGIAGTGLVLLGANVILRHKGLPTKNDNTLLGILALAWGGLELGRPYLRLLFGNVDLDWVIFASLLITLGVILLTRVLLRFRKLGPEDLR